MGLEYTPTLADTIRAPTLDALVPDACLPPVGDLFSATPELPEYLKNVAGKPVVPELPAWNTRRPFLTGRFLHDAAVEQQGSKGGSRGGDTRAQVLESYPAAVQESLREHQWCWDGTGVLGALVAQGMLLQGSQGPLNISMYACLPMLMSAVVDDLLSAFVGLSGGYVRAKPLAASGGERLGYEIAASGQLEPALQEMAARMLPIWCGGWAVLLGCCCCCGC